MIDKLTYKVVTNNITVALQLINKVFDVFEATHLLLELEKCILNITYHKIIKLFMMDTWFHILVS